ncbi:hypothetical protein BDZ89DRAFT_1042721 [Hymenopellis radicata]|nr:hypothetical protein BDZ89DRAFT_1042721 [Hymenopellis radicata]
MYMITPLSYAMTYAGDGTEGGGLDWEEILREDTPQTRLPACTGARMDWAPMYMPRSRTRKAFLLTQQRLIFAAKELEDSDHSALHSHLIPISSPPTGRCPIVTAHNDSHPWGTTFDASTVPVARSATQQCRIRPAAIALQTRQGALVPRRRRRRIAPNLLLWLALDANHLEKDCLPLWVLLAIQALTDEPYTTIIPIYRTRRVEAAGC